MFRSEKGSALPLVLIVVVVLTLLGIALLQYSVTETVQVNRDERKMKAHYLARSGAQNVAMYLLNNYDLGEAFINDLIQAPKSDPVDGLGDGVYELVEVEVFGDLNTIYIESTGNVGDVVQSVLLSVTKLGIFDSVLFANSILFVGATAEIYGDVVYKDWVSLDERIIKDGVLVQDDRVYPDAEVPVINELSPDIIKRSATITDDYRCLNIELVNKHHVLTIELGANADSYKDINVVVQDFKFNGGDIVLNGHGRLLLFLDNFTGGGNFITTPGSDADIIIFVSEGGSFDLSGTPNFEGAIYAPNAGFVSGGNCNITGSVIASTINAGGNLKIYYKEINTKDIPIQLYRLGTWRYNR